MPRERRRQSGATTPQRSCPYHSHSNERAALALNPRHPKALFPGAIGRIINRISSGSMKLAAFLARPLFPPCSPSCSGSLNAYSAGKNRPRFGGEKEACMAIPFVREMAFEYGRLDEVAPGLRRMVVNNPGGFTFHGTNTYVIAAFDETEKYL